jgi:bifunctional DNA-binding transcriptional regulator/antitoxin component of YhaV-PrlF toxin-antitoxin module
MQTLSVSKLTSKSQATIPGRIRKQLSLKAGDTVAFKLRAGLVYRQKARPVDHVMARAVGEALQDEWDSVHDERAYRDL